MATTKFPSSSNRIDRWLRVTGIVLAALGAADALYLWVLKITSTEAMCVGNSGCLTVNNSPYSEIAGVPVSALGLVVYLIILGALALEPRSALLAQYGPLAVFGLSLTGVAFSAYLTYLEFYVIQAFCPFCIISAVLITLILLLSTARLMRQTLYSD